MNKKQREWRGWLMFWVNCAINMIAFDWEKKKENENKFGEEKMLSKSKEKEGKGKWVGSCDGVK